MYELTCMCPPNKCVTGKQFILQKTLKVSGILTTVNDTSSVTSYNMYNYNSTYIDGVHP